LWLQQGLFLSNGGCGYVKKPDLFYAAPVVAPGVGASASGAFDPSVKQPVKTTLKVRKL
jgi:phosphatidylinositol phospholipase C delta